MGPTPKIYPMFLILVFAGAASVEYAHGTPTSPLALDGLGTNTTCESRGIVGNNPLCDAQLISTTHGHDLIMLIAQCGCPGISSITDSSGLTFTRRVFFGEGFGVGGLSEYYARAESPLTSDNVTVMFSGDTWMHGIQLLAIHGANTGSIFDPNPSIPGTCALLDCCPTFVPNGTLVCVNTNSFVSIQTSRIDFVIATVAINDAGPCGDGGTGSPLGFTTITNHGDSGFFEVYYTITSVPKSSIVFSCNGTDVSAIVVDAIAFRGMTGM